MSLWKKTADRRSQKKSTKLARLGDLANRRHRLRLEPLEDRRMLAVLHVDADALTGGDGLTWGSAYNDLQLALDQAELLNADEIETNNIDQIWIAEGTYKPTKLLEAEDARSASFSLLNNVILYGGFEGTEAAIDQRDRTTHETVLSGDLGIQDDTSDNSYTVVYSGENIEATLDGVTVTGGNADRANDWIHFERSFGGGIFNSGNLNVANSSILDNCNGGGIANRNGTFTLSNSIISGNSSSGGGGIRNDNGIFFVIDSTISSNSAASGGGIYNYGTFTVTKSTVSNNSTKADSSYSGGGGIYNHGTLNVTNSTISRNFSKTDGSNSGGGGIFNRDTLTVVNSTISGNSISTNRFWGSSQGAGIYNNPNDTLTVLLNNTIVAGNGTSSNNDIYDPSNAISGSYNLIGDGTGQSALVNGVNGNLVGTSSSPINPLFSDWTQFDTGQWGYYLLPGSPAINSGNNGIGLDPAGQPLSFDLAGNNRIQNGTIDIGAVEFVTAGPSAQTYMVESLDNTIACDGVLTFLEALEAASRNQPVGDAEGGSFSQQDVIRFADGLNGTILLEDGELTIFGNLSIEGPGAEFLTFDAQGHNRVFSIQPNISVNLSGMTITGGSADKGGGIWNDNGTLSVTSSIIVGNSATKENDGSGGGIYNSGGLTVSNTTIARNSARCNGGGIYHFNGTLSVINSTLSGNSADGNDFSNGGGGIYRQYGTATLNNTIVAGNGAMHGPDIYSHFDEWLSGSHNLIGNGSDQSSLVDGDHGNLVGSVGSPIDPMLSDWTHSGYYLLAGSPAINAGNNDLALDSAGQALTVDLSGTDRIQNETVDIGAMEGVVGGSPARVYTVESLDKTIANDGILTFFEAFEAANLNQPVGDALAGSFSEQDVIQFASGLNGTILLEEGELTVFGDLSIEGPGVELLTFDAQGQSRVFSIQPNVSVSLSGMTITGGSADKGGGIWNKYGMLTVRSSTISGNSAGKGGGICNSGEVTVTNSILLDNLADGTETQSGGGGIYNQGWYGTVTIINSTLSENSVKGSNSDSGGGGIYNFGRYGSVTVTNSTLSSNSAVVSSGGGGGIFNYGQCGTVTVTNSIFSENSGNLGGGGIYNHGFDGSVTITNSTFSGNSTGCTDSDRGGGGILNYSGTTTLNNTIVAGNKALAGPDIKLSYGKVFGSHNLIGVGSGSLANNGNLAGTYISPIDPMLSDWTQFDNGQWGYYLLPGSPAIDAGNNSLALDPAGQILTVDLLGNNRVQNGTVDIGAMEGSTEGNSAQTYTVESLENTIANDGILTFLEAFEAANLNQPVGDAVAGSFREQDIIQFADGLSGSILLEDRELAILGDLSIEGPDAELLSFDAQEKNRAFFIQPDVSVHLSGMTITGGSADKGGGIHNHYGTLTVSNSTILGNLANENGGGIYNRGVMTVSNCSLLENSAKGIQWRGGGGIYNQGTLTVTNSTFIDNSSDYMGGGICNKETLTVTNSMFAGNSAVSGGGIHNEGTMTVTNSTLTANLASGSGGGISSHHFRRFVKATLNNTIVAKNIARFTDDIAHDSSSELSGFNNLIGDGTGQSGLTNNVNGNLVGTSSSPIDPKLSDWTQFDNDRWGYHLLSDSPAIDAGNHDLALDPTVQALTVDLYGNHRIQNGMIDIGAIEGATMGHSTQTYTIASLDNTIASDGVLTFFEAFEAANSNQPVGDAQAGSFHEKDVIQFADGLSGTILVDEGEIIIIGSLDIEGPGADLLTFDAHGKNRVFLIKPNVSANISGITITGGSADKGGGIFNQYGTLTITNSTITSNSATEEYIGDGGGIYNTGVLTVNNTTVEKNSANCDGGGIHDNKGTLTVINSTFSDNLAKDDGGGIFSEGRLTASNSKFMRNSALGSDKESGGGGIYNCYRQATITNCTVWGNSAVGTESESGGGGIYNHYGTLTITNSTIAGNSADNSNYHCGGGGVYNHGTLTVTNSTLTGNSAVGIASRGGGVYNSYGKSTLATLNNTIVAGNGDSYGPDIHLVHNKLSGSHNLIGKVSSEVTLFNSDNDNLIGTSSSPIDPMLSDWTQFDNGQWGYYLMPGSPAINAGDNNLALDPAGHPLTIDLYGNHRVQNGTIDLGAVEGASEGTSAQTYTVESLDNTIACDGVLTFLEAFEAANLNQPVGDAVAGSFSEQDKIQFADGLCGTILLDDGELAILGNLSVEGPGAESLVFDAESQNRVFSILPSVVASLSGITITGGLAGKGAGICNLGTLTVTNASVTENSAIGEHGSGGGIFNLGQLAITNSTLTGNSATGEQGSGGGLYNYGEITIANSTLSKNSADGTKYDNGGGGIHNRGTVTVINSSLSENKASYGGGGIHNRGGTATFSDSLFISNSSRSGGGIFNAEGTVTVMNSTLSSNSAICGGGIYNWKKVIVTNSTLTNNSVTCNGGGIYNIKTLAITNSTLADNSGTGAGSRGGGIYNCGDSSTATLNNTIVAENKASSGPDFYLWLGTLSGSHNLIGDGTGQSTLVNGVSGNLVGFPSSPIDPLFIDSEGNDYRLLPKSPAIDAGNSSLAVDAAGAPLLTDIAEQPRIISISVDIGAYESQHATTPLFSWQSHLRICQWGEESWTDALGQASAIPKSIDWIDEWTECWLEIWGTVNHSGVGTFDVTLDYPETYFAPEMDLFEFGGGVASTFMNVDTDNGTVSFSGTTTTGGLGIDQPVLLGRVPMKPVPGASAMPASPTDGYAEAIDIEFAFDQFTASSFGGDATITMTESTPATVELWPKLHDLDRDGQVDIKDIIRLIGVYKNVPGESTLDDVWAADFDRNGLVDIKDIIGMIGSYKVNKTDLDGRTEYPFDFPFQREEQTNDNSGSGCTTSQSDNSTEIIFLAVSMDADNQRREEEADEKENSTTAIDAVWSEYELSQ